MASNDLCCNGDSSDDEDLAVIAAVTTLIEATVATVQFRKTPSFWMRELYRERAQKGWVADTLPMLRDRDLEKYHCFMRMSPDKFDYLLNLVKSHIEKETTKFRDPISAEERLALTIYFLAHGPSYETLSFAFRVSKSSISRILPETCDALWSVLQPLYVKLPATEEDWLEVAAGFEKRWQFPHCIGSIDGKHITVECPQKTGSVNFNYKGNFSKLMLAVADSCYKFIYVDIGHYGSQSDGAVFRNSALLCGIENNTFNIPAARALPHCNENFPYVFVGDEAFPLKSFLMRPYPGKQLPYNHRVFNYRLSRARRVVENAFGVMAARFRILRRPFKASESTTDSVVKACVCLHNFLLESTPLYCPPGFTDSGDEENGSWRNDSDDVQGLGDIGRMGQNNHTAAAADLRNMMCRYFSTYGTVEWQHEYIFRC